MYALLNELKLTKMYNEIAYISTCVIVSTQLVNLLMRFLFNVYLLERQTNKIAKCQA